MSNDPYLDPDLSWYCSWCATRHYPGDICWAVEESFALLKRTKRKGVITYHHVNCIHGGEDHDGACAPPTLPGEIISD